jgi:MinD-like ATPase involved in chromosome partitioning or flagellar assembly
VAGPPIEDNTGETAASTLDQGAFADQDMDVDSFIHEVTAPIAAATGSEQLVDARGDLEAGYPAPAARGIQSEVAGGGEAVTFRPARSAGITSAQRKPGGASTVVAESAAPSLREARRASRPQGPASDDTNWRRDGIMPVAESGWRRWLYFASGKAINAGEKPADIAARELDRKLQTPITGDFSLGIVQLKGGAAKTTTAIGIGNAFAQVRTDAVLAVDVNPDRGNLARRTRARTAADVFTLLSAPRPKRVQELRSYTNETPSGLEILASAQDPATAQTFSAGDYHDVLDIVTSFYPLIISDCGTNITHQAAQAVLSRADALVIPLDAKNDSAEEAVAAIDYLHNAYAKDLDTNRALTDEHGNYQWLYRHLLARTIVVISHQRPGKRMFDVDKSLKWFKERVMDVHVIPYDPHLEESAEIIPDRLNPATRLAYRELAAKVAVLFPAAYAAGDLAHAD